LSLFFSEENEIKGGDKNTIAGGLHVVGDRDIIRQIYADNGFGATYYRFQRDLDVEFDAEGRVHSFSLPIHAKCDISKIALLWHLKTLGFKKTWQSRVSVPPLAQLYDHPTLERVIFESVLFQNPAVVCELNPDQISSLAFRYTHYNSWDTLAQFTLLHELELVLKNRIDWPTICNFSELRALSIYGGGVPTLVGIERLDNLEELSVLGNPGIRDVRSLSNCQILSTLRLSDASASNLAPLADLSNLKVLEWHECASTDYSPLGKLAGLTQLDLYKAQVTDVSFLGNFSQLRSLQLEGTQVADITPLQNCLALEDLNLSQTPTQDLHSLQNLPELRVLDLNKTRLADLAPLSTLPSLETLYLIDAHWDDLLPLAGAVSLRALHVRESQDPAVQDQLRQLVAACPDLQVEIYPLG